MELHFSVDYRTSWGESVSVEIHLHWTSGRVVTQLFPLDTKNGENWNGKVSLQTKDADRFSYQYVITRDAQILRREWNAVPRLFPAATAKDFTFNDFWRDAPTDNHLYSQAYIHSVSHFSPSSIAFTYFEKTLVFRVLAPQLLPGQKLALIGSQPALGNWDVNRSLHMNRGGLNEWILSISAEGLYLPFEYKYVVLDEKSGELVAWEDGDNRVSPYGFIENNHVIAFNDFPLRMHAERWKVAGIVIPVFSLRSKDSQGVGDFHDLCTMADWASMSGMHAIQLLPIYDTTQTHTSSDSYPYSSISIYALHPMYLNLKQLPAISNEEYMAAFRKECARLNKLPQVDYEAVMKLKEEYLHLLYEQEYRRLQKNEDYKHFVEENDEWLTPYAAFCFLRDKYDGCNFNHWPEYSKYNAADIAKLSEKKKKAFGYYKYVQYLLDSQLSAASAYAHQRGVILKGDIPIGISRYSVEAWMEPHYFHMNGQAGAPPDAFSTNGQNWGFPTYNWERMAQDGYRWWVNRFRKMSRYFDAYRIDHVLGFFRIWQIPMHSVHGLLGQFSPSLPMSVDEIENFGLRFQKEMFTRPYITDEMIDEIFGAKAEDVRKKFLCKRDDGTWAMKSAYETQRQVHSVFMGLKDEDSIAIRDGLYQLISDVLFIPDSQNPELYHPRIAVMDDYVFKSLPWFEQEAFLRLYEHYYYHRHNDFWYEQAMQKLPTLVGATQMLVCAEDLGMVPACVGPVLEQLRVLSLEIQAMPKEIGLQFGQLEHNPYNSVATIFTHDMPTLRGWWAEDPERTQQYYNNSLQHDGKAPAEMPAWLCEEVVARHLFCPSMLCLISFQDWLSIDEQLRHPNPDDERINVPANPNHYWRYRMHLNIEDLIKNKQFTQQVKLLIERSGRA